MKQILAVITDWQVAATVVERAALIADAFAAQLAVYRPVHDQIEELNRYIGFDNYKQMRDEILAEETSRLAQLLAGKDIEQTVEWRTMPHRGMVELARRMGSDLIVMAVSHHSPFADMLLKPSDWHLLREAPCTVLILTRAEHRADAVTAAIDCLDESEENLALAGRILAQAADMANVFSVPLEVVSVIPDPALITTEMNNLPLIADFRDEAGAMAELRLQKLLANYEVTVDQQQVSFERLQTVLRHAADAGKLVVVGNRGNKGLRGFLVGNTAERLLHHLSGDLLVVN